MYPLLNDKINSFIRGINLSNFNEKKFINNLREELNVFHFYIDRINFLDKSIIEIKKIIKEHKNKCKNLNCYTEKCYLSAIYFINEEKKINDISKISNKILKTENNLPNNHQKQEFLSIINNITKKLEETNYKQENIYTEIEELKKKTDTISLKDLKIILLSKIDLFLPKTLSGIWELVIGYLEK